VRSCINKIKYWFIILVTFNLNLVLINLYQINIEFIFLEDLKYK